jgi:(S)-2-hydroxyglutarate dehydrogenase
MIEKKDFIIIGAGIVGLVLALKLKKKYPHKSILVLDKESNSIKHGTGRNSGVIHSGIYYPPGTLRAQYCVSGSKQLKSYVQEKNLWIDECGKILLPTSKKSCSSLELLLERAEKNSIYAKKVHSEEILHLEPNANPVFGEGIFIPFTSVVNPKEVAISIMEDIKDLGVEVVYNSEVTNINSKKGIVECGKSNFIGDILVNSAGLQADNISKLSGYKTDYSFLPFKGKYWEVNNNLKMSKLLYPIPNLDLPFLGIHSVHNKLGDIYLGPSSTPVFGRENYNGIKGLSIKEAFFLLLSFATKIIFNTNGLRSLAFREIKLFSLKGVLAEAKNLMTGIEKSHFKLSNTKLGIRSQIFDKKNRTLVSDFVIEKDKKVIHILNAISPAFTASFGLADYIIENIINENN